MLSTVVRPDPGALFSGIDFAGRDTVVAAVSGGGDSLALLFLLNEFLRRRPNAPALLAVTVDHGLRREAASEAQAVGLLAAEHGIPHRILRWWGPKPTAGISVAAREARLMLLAQAARQAGANLVLTGHTADDQAETLAMRLARGEGRGAAGIAPATLYDGDIWFVRPLIQTRREALRAFLRTRGLSWFEDPTNRDPRFERARMRRQLDEASIRRLVEEARSAAAAREAAGQEAARLIAMAERPMPGLLRLPVEVLVAAEAGAYAFRILLAVAGGTPHLPDEARSSSTLARSGGDVFRATLSRAVVTGGQGQLYFHRERRNLPERPAVQELIWDGRYRIHVMEEATGLTIAPFGRNNAEGADISGFTAPPGLVRAALACEPALWKGAECLGLAANCGETSVRPVAAPWALLLPSFDLAPAAAVTTLLGSDPLPPAPWHGHNEEMR